MGKYVALQRLTLLDKDYKGGEVLPASAIDQERVGAAIYAGVLVYVPEAGEQYPGPWPGEHHHFSSEMKSIVDQAIANTSAPAVSTPAPKTKAVKAKAKAKPETPSSDEESDSEAK